MLHSLIHRFSGFPPEGVHARTLSVIQNPEMPDFNPPWDLGTPHAPSARGNSVNPESIPAGRGGRVYLLRYRWRAGAEGYAQIEGRWADRLGWAGAGQPANRRDVRCAHGSSDAFVRGRCGRGGGEVCSTPSTPRLCDSAARVCLT